MGIKENAQLFEAFPFAFFIGERWVSPRVAFSMLAGLAGGEGGRAVRSTHRDFYQGF